MHQQHARNPPTDTVGSTMLFNTHCIPSAPAYTPIAFICANCPPYHASRGQYNLFEPIHIPRVRSQDPVGRKRRPCRVQRHLFQTTVVGCIEKMGGESSCVIQREGNIFSCHHQRISDVSDGMKWALKEFRAIQATGQGRSRTKCS